MMPLVLVPGHLCDARVYAPQIAALSGTADVIIAETGRDNSIALMAERVLQDAPEQFVIAGLSMGGMVAMEVMLRAPERVLGAALWSTDPHAASDKERAWRAAMKAGVAQHGLAHFVDRFAAAFYRHDDDVSGRLLAPSRTMMLDTPVDVYERQAEALDGRREMIAALEGWAGPVEIVVGAEDRICPPEPHRTLARALPGGSLSVVPGCGHISTLEAPGVVTASLRRLFNSG
ncbi:MAG: alpha/beta fold hydrolase [Pseudomonadota bacterium]